MSTTDPKINKKVSPPYISVARLEKMLEISSRKTPKEVSITLFTSNGFSKVDALLAISTLRFLNLIDENNAPKDTMASLGFTGEKGKEVLEKIVKEAYLPLFENVHEPQKLERDDLFNALKANYPGLSNRVYNSAVPVFLKLCEKAGLKEEGSVKNFSVKAHVERKIGKNENKKSGKASAVSQKEIPEGFHEQQIVKGRMFVVIPEDIFIRTGKEEELNKAWFSMLKAAHDFADKYLKDETPGADEPGVG